MTDDRGARADRPRIPLTVIVLARDEALNLGACLESVAGWASDLVVVDSGSTDETLDIARRHGARVLLHAFETHARQWAWALANAAPATEWVLALDADQRVTPGLRDEIAAVVARPPDDPSRLAGAYLPRRQIFRGRWIRHGGYYPKYLLKLFRRGHVWVDEADLVDHHFRVTGPLATLSHDLVEDNRKEADLAVWIAKHVRYAALQARQEWEASRAPLRSGESAGDRAGLRPDLFGHPDQRVAWQKSLWARLPLYVRPCLYFAYRYVLRLGFLDGRQGFVFHVLQGFWYRLLVDVELDELRRAAARRARASAPGIEADRRGAVAPEDRRPEAPRA